MQTFAGFDELDSFIEAVFSTRCGQKGWRALITSLNERITSMTGVTIERQQPLEFAADANAVAIGGGIHTERSQQTGICWIASGSIPRDN
jgi:hypothetical protein